jgi:hypothetical protein
LFFAKDVRLIMFQFLNGLQTPASVTGNCLAACSEKQQEVATPKIAEAVAMRHTIGHQFGLRIFGEPSNNKGGGPIFL